VASVDSGLGDFGKRLLVDAFEPRLADASPDETVQGLTLANHWFYGGLRDSAGHQYIVYRKSISSMTSGLQLMTDLDAESIRVHPAALRTARGEIRRAFSDRERRWTGHSLLAAGLDCDEQPVELRLTDTDLYWSEGDVLTLSGRLAGSGIQFLQPSRGFPLLYTSQPYALAGTILGQQVSGFVSLDQYYAPPGKDLKESPFFGDFEAAWLTFTNEFDDGTIQFGHVLRGTRAGAGAVVEGANLVAHTEQLGGDYHLGSDDFVTRAVLDIGTATWEFVGEEAGRLHQFSNARWNGYRAQCGVTARPDDPRQIIRSWSWLESFADRLRGLGAKKEVQHA
jgi:hypothetical protein